MTTATRRLRRASIAGLATIATVGGVLATTGGTALAFVAGDDVVVAGSSATLAVGASGQSLNDVTVTFPANSSAAEFTAGEQLIFTLTSDGTPVVNNTSGNTLNTASFAAAPTVTATNGATVTTSLATGTLANSKGNDSFTVTFTNSAAKNTTATKLTISGLKVNLGSAVAPGQHLQLVAAVAAGSVLNIFDNGAGTPGQTTATITVGTIPQVSLTDSKVAVATPGAANVASLGTLTIKVADANAVKNTDTLTLTLSPVAAVWDTAPTASGSPAVTVGAAGGNTLTLTVNANSAAGNTITLTGAKIKGVAAAGAVTVKLTGTNIAAATAPSVQVAAYVTQARLGGADRYGTASLVFNKGAFTSNSVILTSGANFPDALSAQYLAKALSTGGFTVGILTTDPNNLTSSTKTVLTNGTIDTVYVVGGTAAVSANVANQVAALHKGNVPINANLNVIRIAGADRYATNNAADLYLGATGGTTHAYIATGAKFADALAIGPVVYKTGDPLILTDGASLVASAKATIQSLGITNVTIVGGTSAISTAVETALTNLGVTIDGRLSGADRTQTAAAIAKDAVTNHGFTLGNVYIARGDNFADALVAGPLAGSVSNPILLTGDPNTLGAGIPSVLGGQAGTVTTVTALGLTSAVSVQTLNAAAASLS